MESQHIDKFNNTNKNLKESGDNLKLTHLIGKNIRIYEDKYKP